VVERFRGAERVEVGSELAVELDTAAVVPGHVGQVVGELVPGVQMRPLAGLDFAKLVVPVVQMPLELSLSSGVALLPVAPAAYIGRRTGEIQNPKGRLDVCPLFERRRFYPHRQGFGLVAEQPQRRIGRVPGLEELLDPRTIQGAALPLLCRSSGGSDLPYKRCRQGLVGRHCPLAQLIGRASAQ
jgi:hypothetical protein